MEHFFIEGIEARELDIYKHLLSLKRATVLELARVASERRSNLYRILDSLIQKRLVSEIFEGKRHYYIAESPQVLKSYVNKQKEKVNMLLPELEAIEKEALERPKIKYYEGKAGIQNLYDELLEEKEEILAFAWPEKLLTKIEAHHEFVKKRIKLGIPARVIYPDTLTARRRVTGLREVRFSKHLPSFDATYMIAGNKVVMFSHKRWITGVLIENKELAQGLRAFFDALWLELEIHKKA